MLVVVGYKTCVLKGGGFKGWIDGCHQGIRTQQH